MLSKLKVTSCQLLYLYMFGELVQTIFHKNFWKGHCRKKWLEYLPKYMLHTYMMDDNDIHRCNDLSYINYHMKCLLYSRIDSKISNVWFIIFASFVGCHPWHMLLIFEKEVIYVFYKKTQIQRNENNDNGRKHNKRPTKWKEQKIWGQFSIQKWKKKE